MPARTAWSVSSGRSISISSAITPRRCTSNGLKPSPKSRFTSASRGASSSVNTWWYLRHSSPSHCTVSESGATTRQRSTRPVCTSRLRISAASTVFPRPTSSASSHRTGSVALARSATCNWWGKSRTRPPRNGPRPSASRSVSRCRMSSRVRKSPSSSTSPSASRSSRALSSAIGHSAWVGTVCPFARRIVPSGSRAATVVSSRVAETRTGRPRLRSTGASAAVSAPKRKVVLECGNSATTTRPSSAVTRPMPSSGLKRWVRRSPGVQVRPGVTSELQADEAVDPQVQLPTDAGFDADD